MNNICVFCLSKYRKLCLINDEQLRAFNIVSDVKFKTNIKYLHTKNLLKLCWECNTKFIKLSSFLKCAQQSCSYLINYMKQTTSADMDLPPSLSKLCRTEVQIINSLSFDNEEWNINSSTKQVATAEDQKIPSLNEIEDEEFSSSNASLCNVEDNGVKAPLDNINEDRTLDSSSDSDNEPLANRVISKKKMKTKKAYMKPSNRNINLTKANINNDAKEHIIALHTSGRNISQIAKETGLSRKPKMHTLPKCTVSWASNSQAQEWYQDERKAERVHNPSYTLTCDACERAFPDVDALNIHIQQSHNEEAGQFVCNLCLYRFPDISLLKQHVEYHYVYYKCNECSYVTQTLALMQAHTKERHHIIREKVRKDTEKKTVKCRRCKNDFLSGEVIKTHRKECQLYKCDECQMSCTNASSYKRHKIKHKNATAEAYTYCEGCKSYIKNTWYKKHFLTSLKHVSRDTFKFPCSVCLVKMPTSYTLKLHMFKVHLKRGVHQCQLCPAYYMNRKHLDRHLASKHQLGTWETKRDKICEQCGKGFTSNTLLSDHLRTHSGERPHRCEFCPATFAQQGNLYRHNLTVHRKRIAKTGSADADKVCCDICDKEFRTKFLLKSHHDYFHLKKTKYKCDACDKYFISSLNLRYHNECRHGLVTLKKSCPTCGKLFKTAHALNLHSKSNCFSGECPQTATADEYKCRECDGSYRRASTLYAHYKMKHLKLKRNDRVAIKNLYNPEKEIIVIRDPVKSSVSEKTVVSDVI